MTWLHDHGVLPPPHRDASGTRRYAPADVTASRDLLASWEAAVTEELEAEGWLTGPEAAARYGLATHVLKRLGETGKVRAQLRTVVSGRAVMVVWRQDLDALGRASAS